MASAKDLKKRISSINNTSKITKAMEMVSAAKMQKAQSQVAAAIPYAEGVYQLVNNLNQVSDYYHPFLE